MKTTLPLLALLCLFFNLSKAQDWVPVSIGAVPNEYIFVSLSVPDENTAWAAAIEYVGNPVPSDHVIKLLRTTDGGQTWIQKELLDEPLVGRMTWEIHAIDSLNAWISSNRLEATDTRPIFKTTDGGDTWQQVDLINMSGGVFIHFFDPLHGLVIRNSLVAVSSDGGETWTPVTSPQWPLAPDEFGIMWGPSSINHNASVGNHFWFGSSKGRVLHSSDRGLTWTAVQVGTTSENIHSLAFTDTLHGVAIITDNGGNPYPNAKIFETFDGGQSWTQAAAPPFNSISSIAAVPGSLNTFVAGDLLNSDPVIAHNQQGIGNSSWVYDEGMIFNACGFEFASPTVGFAAGYYDDGTNVILKWNGDLTQPSAAREPLLKNVALRTFPSPFSEALQIQVDFTDSYGISSGTLEVYNLKGVRLFLENIDNQTIWNKTIPAQGWAPGAYFLKVRTAEGIVLRKVVKQ
jgi:hypothetical protein